MSPNLSRLDRLLGTEISTAVTSIPGADDIVAEHLRENREIFDTWTKELGLADERAIRTHFRELLLNAERELVRHHDWGDLSRREDLERAVRFLASKRPSMRAGMYLRDDSAILLLSNHLPVNLMRAMGARTLEDLFSHFTLLDIIALTRHTESREWQDAYLDELATLSSRHFEMRPVRFLVVDRGFLSRASDVVERELKPWSVSHNKESGTITFYTHDPADGIATPALLLTMLFFHYYFETLRAAHLAREWGERHEDQSGNRFAQMIRTTQRSFSFDNPNVHSEAFHWEDAISYIGALFPLTSFGEYVAHLPRGEFATTDALEPLSLNIVDHLWDLNLDTRSEYFDQESSSFVYHFREALWSKILQGIRKLTTTEMRSTVFAQLELDDAAFTQRMLGTQDV